MKPLLAKLAVTPDLLHPVNAAPHRHGPAGVAIAFLMAAFLASEVSGQDGPNPPGAGGVIKPAPLPENAGVLRPEFLSPDRRIEPPMHLTDLGDEYRGSSGESIRLLRATNEAALILLPSARPGTSIAAAAARLPVRGLVDGEFARLSDGRPAAVVRTRDPQAGPDFQVLRGLAGITQVCPVLVDPESRLRMIPCGEIIVMLRPGVTPAELEDLCRDEGLQVVQSVGATRLQSYLVRSPDPTFDTLAASRRLFAHPKLRWAAPNFLRELLRHEAPNDPQFPRQFNLNNSGIEGATADADVDALGAWEYTQGSSSVVIAILDDGVDTDHPDLSIRFNEDEMGNGKENNGIDDDGNGFIDDYQGWDFADGDNDPNPHGSSGHGTACAGIAAGRINNHLLVAGIAGGCRVLPIKIFTDAGPATTDANIGNAISYASEHADVLSCSWGGGGSSPFIDSAIHDAVTQGRGGRGCPVFVANGNSASPWTTVAFSVGANLGPGTFSFGFRYHKDFIQAGGEDLVRIDNVVLQDGDGTTLLDSPLGYGGRQDFEGSFPPPGWSLTSNGAAPWELTTVGVFTGTGGYQSARSGVTGNDQWTELRTPAVSLAGDETLLVRVHISSEANYDGLYLRVYQSNGAFIGYYNLISGVPSSYTPISYPARHSDAISVGASTDCDRRSDYSQYGPENDLLAPSNGGWHGVTTLDPLGTVGYTPGDALHSFGGTSAATPLAAGVGALLLSLMPDLTALEIRDHLRATADRIGPIPYVNGFNPEYGFGRINARRALASFHLAVVSFLPQRVEVEETDVDWADVLVHRSPPTDGHLDVPWIVGGTATLGVDYRIARDEGVVFLPDSNRASPEIIILSDTDIEGPETVTFTLQPGPGYLLGTPSTLTLTILDNDRPLVALTALDNTAGEPGNNQGALRLVRTGGIHLSLTVQLMFSGTATPGSDYEALTTTVSFQPGIAETNIVLTVMDDSAVEGDETVIATLEPSPDYLHGSSSSAVLVIVDDDARITTAPGVLRLDGVNAFATSAGSLWPSGSARTSYTIEAWIKPDVLGGLRFIAADDAYDFDFHPGGFVHALYGPSGSYQLASATASPSAGQWNHVAALFDHLTSQVRIALNGVLYPAAAFSESGLFTDSNQHFTLGARRLGPKIAAEGFFDGEIDEVRVSDVVRYTGNFTPATRLTADGNTRALYHFDDPLLSTTFVDSSGYGRTLYGVAGAHAAIAAGPEGMTTPMVGHWRLDESLGLQVSDSSGHGNEGLVINGPTWGNPGVLGTALSMDGVNDLLTIPNAPELEIGKNNADFTVAVWVNLRQGFTGNWRTLLHKGNNASARTPSLWLHPDSNRLHYRVSTVDHFNRGGDSVGSLAVGRWTHVAMVKTGSRLQLYFDGFLDSETFLPSPVIHNSLTLYVGDDPAVYGFNGLLDDLRIYSRALSPLELSDAAGLVAHWRMAEGSGQTVVDSSPYHNDGTIPLIHTNPLWVANGSDWALSFDGGDDRITVPHSSSLEIGKNNADFSIALWVRVNQPASGVWRTLFHKGTSASARTPSIWLHPNSHRLHYRVSTADYFNRGGDSVGTLTVNRWTHIAMVKSGSKLRLYLGGALDSEVTLSSPVVHNTHDLLIGDDPIAVGFPGQIDEMRIYQVAIPPSAIATLAAIPINELGTGGPGSPGFNPQLPANPPQAALQKSGGGGGGPDSPSQPSFQSQARLEDGRLVIRWTAPREVALAGWIAESSLDLIQWIPQGEPETTTIAADAASVTLEWRVPAGPHPFQFVRLSSRTDP